MVLFIPALALAASSTMLPLSPGFQKALESPPPPSSTSAMLFNRAPIVIHPTPVPGKAGEVSIIRPDVAIDAEVRGEDALKLDYIHTLNTLTDSTGVMILLDPPAALALPHMQVFTPVDVLYVAPDGVIQKIIPGVVLSNVSQPMPTQNEAKALLFLKNGQTAARGIKPHDIITGQMFTPAVRVEE